MKSIWRMFAVTLLIIACTIISAPILLAEESVAGVSSGASIGDFLTSDGRFDLEKARRAGFEGSLNMDGFSSDLDPATGQPVFRAKSVSVEDTDPDDIYWNNSMSSSVPGLRGQDFLGLTVYDGKLIAAGDFRIAGGVAVNGIAAWDGTSWSSLESGLSGFARALTVYDGKLIAGMETNDASDVSTWDGTSWSPLGSLQGSVRAFVIYNGKLVAGGVIDSTNIAVWDGTAWSALDSGTAGDYPPQVYALTVYNGKLIAGGNFTVAGGDSIAHVAAWDGSSWSSLGEGMNLAVGALTVYHDKLVAGGCFTKSGDVRVDFFAKWDGTSWTGMNTGISAVVSVHAFTSYNDNLIAIGNIATTSGGISIAVWNDSSWSALGSGTNGTVFASTIYNGRFVAGGGFSSIGGVTANKIAAWDGTSWSPLGSGIKRSYINALTVYDGKLIAGGNITVAGDDSVKNIAAWDGTSWSSLGAGLNGEVCSLAEYGGKLIAGGEFTAAGDNPANKIAAWDGTSWSALGSGMGGGSYTVVNALTVYDGKLIAGGYFQIAGNDSARNIALWDGTSWSPLGNGLDRHVFALTIYDDKPVAGGDVITSAWDGSSWASLGSGTGSSTYALIVHDGTLIAGGYAFISAWDGSAWSSLGSGINNTICLFAPYGEVHSLASYNDNLVVGGFFEVAGGKIALNIARWTKSYSGVAEESAVLPTALKLCPNAPNPFNPSTALRFETAQKLSVQVVMYNVLGQRVRVLQNGVMDAGSHTLVWDGRDDSGKMAASGAYFYTVKAGANVAAGKVMFMR